VRKAIVVWGGWEGHQPDIVAQYIAECLGCYIVGVTWFARREASTSRRGDLICGLLIIVAAIMLLVDFPDLMRKNELDPAYRFMSGPMMFTWAFLLAGLILLLTARFLFAIIMPEPAAVQAAVKSGILFVIALDAAVLVPVRGMWPAFIVLSLLLPSVLLGRWIYST